MTTSLQCYLTVMILMLCCYLLIDKEIRNIQMGTEQGGADVEPYLYDISLIRFVLLGSTNFNFHSFAKVNTTKYCFLHVGKQPVQQLLAPWVFDILAVRYPNTEAHRLNPYWQSIQERDVTWEVLIV